MREARTMTTKLLGIDVGTGGTRAVLLDETGQVLGAATAEHAPMSSSKVGWAEQDPRDWWRAACSAIRECMTKAGASGGDISGIGVTGQMHGLVLLDAQGEVLRPSIIWCDQRTDAQCRAITERVGAQRLIELTANPALTGFTLPKIVWVREHEPEIWSRTRSVLLPKDYVRFRMTGAFATDVADASGTLLFDVVNRRWSVPMLEMFGVRSELLPSVFESPEITGRVSRDGASATGLREGTPVAAGGGDQSAGAVAMGIVRPGDVSATIGTSGVVFAATSSPVLEPQGRIHTFCHAVPGRWHVMGVTQGAGLSLRWFREQFGVAKRGSDRACRRRRASVDAVSDGRAYAALGSLCAGRLGRTHSTTHPRARHPRHPRGCGVQLARHSDDFSRPECAGKIHPTWRRRRAEFRVAADSSRHLRNARGFDWRGRRPGVWWRIARRRWHRRLAVRRCGVRDRGTRREACAADSAERGVNESPLPGLSKDLSSATENQPRVTRGTELGQGVGYAGPSMRHFNWPGK